jgi:HAD superfamily hydrolase (TIGR01484 family)
MNSPKKLSLWNESSDPYFNQRNTIAFDLDDTLTVHGELSSETIRELELAGEKGWLRILVTGRSAGWVDAIIKLLPFDGVVGENGALLSFWQNKRGNRLEREEPKKLFWTPKGYKDAPPEGLQEKFNSTASTIMKAVPGTRIASDQRYRIYDLAIDFAEEVDPPLPLDDAYKIQKLFEENGAVAKVSSIHVNGWWGNFSKRDGLTELLEKIWSRSIADNLIYAGDSPNDGPLFECAGVSVGVSNIEPFLSRTDFHKPLYITEGEGGHGSVELLRKLKVV